MEDIIKAIQQHNKKKNSLPRYVIFEPDMVPEIGGEITTTLTKKVNKLVVKFDNFVELVGPTVQEFQKLSRVKE
ncbi:hypothetical protein QYM36_014468 [Artemia franciscana]|uniref:Uncharacterized protein n=1 Tax=Artemia franciscana TaxID=6661 RepID=A0AA88L117_ARTSF|nr:hypothetical protein QYM36_014468 [Artemia franciscana]